MKMNSNILTLISGGGAIGTQEIIQNIPAQDATSELLKYTLQIIAGIVSILVIWSNKKASKTINNNSENDNENTSRKK